MMGRVGDVLWEPSDSFRDGSRLVHYMEWLRDHKGVEFDEYNDLWRWSVDELEDFWDSIWDFFQVKASRGPEEILSGREMPGARWFRGARLNYAEQIFRYKDRESPAIMFKSELCGLTEWGWDKLYVEVASFARGLRELGVVRGDRVAAYMPNIPEVIVGFLACASVGAVWSVSSPDFGSETVVSRFKQIEPKVLLAVDGYRFAGKDFNRLAEVRAIQDEIPSIEKTVILPYLSGDAALLDGVADYEWDEFVGRFESDELVYEQVEFEHPLWILYSSGTTGIPKAIVQGQGNIILEHYKALALHMDVREGDRLFWYTTTGWMIWNMLVSGLLMGSTVVLYDGSPTSPSPDVIWSFAEEAEIKVFGTSPPFLMASQQFGLKPREKYSLESLRAIASTGAPLSAELYEWVYRDVKEDVWLGSASGGTDICSGFVMMSPLHPVCAGEMQCLALGSKVAAYNEAGDSVVGEVGELVVEAPMPSMPLYFWNDESNERYIESYFEMYNGVWTQGDWIKVNADGSSQIYGRSDSTINRAGIRIGTSEIYRVVEGMPEIIDSLVIDLTQMDGQGRIQLFLVLRDATVDFDEQLLARIRDSVRKKCSPRHVPDDIFAVPDVPRTLNGKKLEVPVKRLLSGEPIEDVVNRGSMSNPDSIEFFVELAGKS